MIWVKWRSTKSQTKYAMAPHNHQTSKGRRRLLCPTFVGIKSASQSQNSCKGPCEDCDGKWSKFFNFRKKESFMDIILSKEEATALKTFSKNPDYSLSLGQRSYFLVKRPLLWQKTVWSWWPLYCSEEKQGGLQAEEPSREAQGWQHHVVELLCCRRDWWTSQNRWRHERNLCGYIAALSQDISHKVWSQMVSSNWTMTPSIFPKLFQKSRYWSGQNQALISI